MIVNLKRIFFILLVSISGAVMAESVTITDSEMKNASGLRIYFGHQSVGYNIIEGIKDLSSGFNIVDSTEAPGEDSFFLHSGVGRNTEPVSKIKDFSEIVSELGEDIDVAFLKFCYIDFSAATDSQEVFTDYQTAVKDLKQKYPDLIFVHLTAPLVTVQKGTESFS